MPKYLIQGSYTADGVKGVLKDGGSKRRAVVKNLTEKMGGKLESFYYAFGDTDFYIVVELKDHTTAAAVTMTVNATGAVSTKTTVLITPEDIDAATKQSVTYTRPGG